MKFESGVRAGDLTLVIKRTGKLIVGAEVVTTDPIIVKFKDHRFDTDKQGYDEETQALVEREMQNKRRFEWFDATSDPRGYWVARVSRKAEGETRPTEPAKQCEAIIGIGTESAHQCPNPAVEGGTVCDDHIMVDA